MKSLHEAKSSIENEGTVVSAKFRKTMRIIIRTVSGVLVLTGLLFFVGIPAADWIKGDGKPSPQTEQESQQTQQQGTGCSAIRPCTVSKRSDGSTMKVHIPESRSVCFEPDFWNNLQKLGYKTSYKGGEKRGTGVFADTFWFVPEAGMNIPRYWFIPEGSLKC